MDRGPDAIRSISHDMRNLLTAVRGHAELALRGISPDDPAREDVAHVVVVTAAVFDLVDQLDGTDSSHALVAANLDSTVAAMRRLLDALLPPDIELELVPDADGAYVSISKLRIERIVLNLALNARDAMTDGGTLSIRTGLDGDATARIVVADTGPGFSEAALEHLFEVGFTTKHERGGSGQGLSALARFVDGAGGAIDVDSEAGEGATITVRLPVAELKDPFSAAGDGAARAAPADEPADGDTAEPEEAAEADEAGTAGSEAEPDEAEEAEEPAAAGTVQRQTDEVDDADTVDPDKAKRRPGAT